MNTRCINLRAMVLMFTRLVALDFRYLSVGDLSIVNNKHSPTCNPIQQLYILRRDGGKQAKCLCIIHCGRNCLAI